MSRRTHSQQSKHCLPDEAESTETPTFRGEWDDEGVYVYQAFRSEIADSAIKHQRLGGEDCTHWKPERMTWIKPSFAWMLYRCGYGRKPGQERVLKIKISHDTLAYLLSHCKLTHTNKDTQDKIKKETTHEGGGNGYEEQKY